MESVMRNQRVKDGVREEQELYVLKTGSVNNNKQTYLHQLAHTDSHYGGRLATTTSTGRCITGSRSDVLTTSSRTESGREWWEGTSLLLLAHGGRLFVVW